MESYHLNLSAKTKFLNYFRTFFQIPYIENLLVSRVNKKPSGFLQKLIPPDYLYKKGSFRKISRNGITYNLDISNVVDHYLYFGLEDANFSPVSDSIKNAKVILDIGANIGTKTLLFASLNPNARIISFEPHPSTFKRALENIKLNNFGNIDLVNIGLGAEKAVLKLYEVNNHNPGMNRILSDEKDLPFKLVNVEVLDNVLAEKQVAKVDFIKLDVEGFEYYILQGAKETLKNYPVLFIELDDNNLKENKSSAKALVELLQSYGYSKFYRADNAEPVTNQTEFSNCHFDLVAKK